MADEASARPGRLLRFELLMGAIQTGLTTRIGILGEALDAYEAGTPAEYQAAISVRTPVLERIDGDVQKLADDLADWGGWVGDVGRSFFAADDGDVDTESDGIVSVAVTQIEGEMRDRHDDPFRGIEEGAAERLGHELFGDDYEYDQDDPPAWFEYMEEYGNLPGVMSALFLEMDLIYSTNELGTLPTPADVRARMRLPSAQAGRLMRVSRWLGRFGNGVTVATSAYGQWVADEGLPGPTRVFRSTTRGGAAGAGAWGGASAGAFAGGLCGPGVVVCAPIGGLAGGLLGAAGGNWVADRLPWMDDRSPVPLEVDLDEVQATIAGEGTGFDGDFGFTQEELATALDAVGDDPVASWHLEQILSESDSSDSSPDWSSRPAGVTATETQVDDIDTLTGRPVGAETHYRGESPVSTNSETLLGVGVVEPRMLWMEAPAPTPPDPPYRPVDTSSGGYLPGGFSTGQAIDAADLAAPLPLALDPRPLDPGTTHGDYMTATMSTDVLVIRAIEQEMTPAQRRRLGW